MHESIYSYDDLREVVKESLKYPTKLILEGYWTIYHKRDNLWLPPLDGKNIIPTAGLNHILNVVFGTENKVANWYVGIFKNNYTPIATNTASDSLGVAGYYGECTNSDYNPQNVRPTYTPVAASGGVITNDANKAEFTIVSSSQFTVYGGFLTSVQTKLSTSGILIAAKKFDNARPVYNGDKLFVLCEITAISQ